MPNMTRMPSLRRRSGLLTLLAATAVAAVVALPALADNDVFPGIEVTIYPPKGGMEHVWLNEIDDPEVNTVLDIRREGRAVRRVPIKDGISVLQILQEASLDVRYGFVEIERPDGSKLVLTKGDVEHPRPPVFYVGSDGDVRFLRPSLGEGDYNQRDHFEIRGAAVSLVQKKSELDVEVTPAEKTIDVGDSVTFKTEVRNGPTGVSYEYDWNFDDGTTKSDGSSQETHKFTKSGSFDVLVAVRIAGSDRSDSATADVEVGDPKESAEDQTGGGSSTGTSDSGTYDGIGTTSSGTSSSTTTTTPSSPTPTPSFDSQTTPSIATAGPTVSGNLLADVSTPAPSNILESAAKAAREGTPKDDDADGATVPEAVFSILVLLVLLTLGAAMEQRQDWRLRRAAKPVG